MGKTVTGVIADIKKFETHDGPGIRTTVFVKGCYLNCKWCANPETKDFHPQLYFIPKRCKGYGKCFKVCPEGALSMNINNKIDRQKCSLCMRCVEACPYSALMQVGREVTADEVIGEVEKDRPFYGSDGGLTVSGGEPLYQPHFTTALLKKCKEKGISTVLDTSGYAKREVLEEVLEYTDLVLLDIKHMDPLKHKEGTGLPNDIIINNARLISKKCMVRISLPLIPGYNDSEENIKETANLAITLGIEWIDIMPLHKLGLSKYEYLGLKSPYSGYREISKEDVLKVRDVFKFYGLKTTIGRMM